MSHELESMAWTGETPWHGLGNKVSGNLTPKEMLRAANLNWKVEKKRLVVEGTRTKVPDRYALVRSTDKSILSVVGSHYKPVQNEVAADFFKKFVKAGHMSMETMGSLHSGRYIWALARINKDFSIGRGSNADEVRGYLLLLSPHLFGKALILLLTPIRVVCWNTLQLSLGRAGDSRFSMPHSMEFNEEARKAAEMALGLSQQQMDEFEDAARLLAKKMAKPKAVELYFNEVLEFDPTEAVKLKDGGIREPKMLVGFRDALVSAPGHDLKTAEGTWWGALNAVTATVDHATGRVRDTALATAWAGYTSVIKRRAFDLAIERARRA